MKWAIFESLSVKNDLKIRFWHNRLHVLAQARCFFTLIKAAHQLILQQTGREHGTPALQRMCGRNAAPPATK